MNDNNASNEEPLNRPATQMQAMETRQEENMEWEGPAPTPATAETAPLPWLKAEEIDGLQSRWNSIQIEFVNDPRASVEQAAALVAEALQRIEQALSNQRALLDAQWTNHTDISTEDLRMALRSYRSFLDRLLAL